MITEEELDSILVELDVFAVQDEKDVWMQGTLQIIINEIKPYGESDIVDAQVFIESLKNDGEYHIFSCCCGMPECSGWIKKIQVSTHENVLKWIEPNSKKVWHFDKNWIQDQLESVEKEVQFFKEYFKKKEIHYVGVGYSW